MRTNFSLLALLVLVGLGVNKLHAIDVLLEAKGAYYSPTGSKFRDIYHEGCLFGAEASIQTWSHLYTWVSLSGFVKDGHSLGLHDPTSVYFLPLGVGIKYLFPVDFVDFYLGAGALATYLHTHDKARGIKENNGAWGGGGIVKGGVIFNYCKHGFIDVFSDYSFLYTAAPKERGSTTHSANLSGWSVGVGIGYRLGSKT